MRKSRTPQRSWLRKTAIAVAVSQLVTVMAPAFAQTVSDMERRMTQRNLVQQAVYQLVAEARDPDGDGTIEGPAMATDASAPDGGGVIPAGSGAPKSDGYSGLLGYCAWDNGSDISSAGRIAGASGANAISVAVISYGLDNTYQTTCAQLASGLGAQGDDFAFWMTNNQVVANNSTNVSLFWGTPVATLDVLNSIGADAAHDGEARLVKSTGKLYQWSSASNAWMILADAGVYADNLNQHLRTSDSPTFASVTATTFTGDLVGNANTATKLKTPASIGAKGDATWSVTFDGSQAVTGDLVLKPSGVTRGSYGTATMVPQFTVDAKGRVISAGNVALAPDWSSITNIPESVLTYAVNSNQFLRTTDSPTFVAVTAGTFNGGLNGNAATASRLETARTIEVTGDANWSVNFDGSGNASAILTLADTKVKPGEYGTESKVAQFAVDSKGRIVSAREVLIKPNWADIAGKPTGISGYAELLDQDVRTTASPTFAAVTATTFNGNLNGNATTASRLETARSLTVTGDANWTVSFDGSGDATAALTLANTNVTPGQYGTETTVPQFTVDSKGRIVSASNVAITPAWASITGIPANLTTGFAANLNQNLRTTDSVTFAAVTATTFNGALNGNASTASQLATARTLSASGDATWSVSFDGSANAAGILTLANSGVTAGTYGSATSVPQFAVDRKGRVTSVSNVTITPAWASITGIPTSLATGGFAANMDQNVRTTDSVKFANLLVSGGTYTATAPVLTVGDQQYGLSSLGGNLYLHTALGGGFNAVVGGVVVGSLVHTGQQVLIDRGSAATDWNTMLTAGVYRVGTASWNDYANVPTTAYSFGTLMIYRSDNSVTQTYYTHSGDIWYRTKWNATDWGTWKQVLNTSNAGYAALLDQNLRTTDSVTFAAVTATTFNGALNGNASTAAQLATARTISATGDARWTVTFDGSANATGVMTLANSGVTAGTYGSSTKVGQFTVDAKGRVTSASVVDLTPAWSSITSIPTAITSYAVNMNQNVRTTDSPTFAGVNTPSVTSTSNLALNAGASGKIVANSKIQLAQQATEDGACTETGAIAIDANNNLFICR